MGLVLYWYESKANPQIFLALSIVGLSLYFLTHHYLQILTQAGRLHFSLLQVQVVELM